MSQAQREFTDGLQYYVNGMQAGSDLGQSLRARVSFGAPVLEDLDSFLDGVSVAAGSTQNVGDFTTAFDAANMAPYGRNVVIDCSGVNATVCIVNGRDYLGQKMSETITFNGTTAVEGDKAFKYVDEIILLAQASETVDIGYGSKLGLPYTSIAILREFEDDILASAGTFVDAVYTDPQTATTGDPRGTVVTTGTLDGTAIFEMDIEFTNSVNSDDNGGLHGIAHYNS